MNAAPEVERRDRGTGSSGSSTQDIENCM